MTCARGGVDGLMHARTKRADSTRTSQTCARTRANTMRERALHARHAHACRPRASRAKRARIERAARAAHWATQRAMLTYSVERGGHR
eukprot:1911700-Pleurochrysis_carterae.AAC.1